MGGGRGFLTGFPNPKPQPSVSWGEFRGFGFYVLEFRILNLISRSLMSTVAVRVLPATTAIPHRNSDLVPGLGYRGYGFGAYVWQMVVRASLAFQDLGRYAARVWEGSCLRLGFGVRFLLWFWL